MHPLGAPRVPKPLLASTPALKRRRPGCTLLTVDLRVDGQDGAAPLLAGGGSGGPGGDDSGEGPSLHRSSSKQGDADPADPDGAAAAAADAARRAALLQSLAAQVLERRSVGVEGAAGPLLMQLNAQQLVAAAGSRLLRSLPLPADAAAQAAGGSPGPVVPRLSAVSPACLVLPPTGAAAAAEPPVLVLTGHGLFTHAGRPGLVLARQHGALPALLPPALLPDGRRAVMCFYPGSKAAGQSGAAGGRRQGCP